jgi:hypothetical protein
VGFTFTSEYHPRQASPPSENFAAISHFYTFEGAIYRLNGAAFTNVFSPVHGIYTGGAWYPFSNAAVRITQTGPATVTPSTQFLWITGQIRNPWGKTGGGTNCVVTFLGNYFRGKEP